MNASFWRPLYFALHTAQQLMLKPCFSTPFVNHIYNVRFKFLRAFHAFSCVLRIWLVSLSNGEGINVKLKGHLKEPIAYLTGELVTRPHLLHKACVHTAAGVPVGFTSLTLSLMTLLSGHKAVSSYAFAENYKEGPVEI